MWDYSLEHAKRTRGHILRKRKRTRKRKEDFIFLRNIHCLEFPGDHLSIYAGILTSLVLCWPCAGSNTYCEFMNSIVMPYSEESFSKCSSLYLGSCTVSAFSSMMLLELRQCLLRGQVKQIIHLGLNIQCLVPRTVVSYTSLH